MSIPNTGQPLADAQGRVTVPWQRWLADLPAAIRRGETTAAAAIAAIATALGSPDGTVENIPPPASTGSFVGHDSLHVEEYEGLRTFRLEGDEASPAATSYYGTDADSVRGFHPVADAFVAGSSITLGVDAGGRTTISALDPLAVYLTDPDGNYLTDPDGNPLISEGPSTSQLAEGTNLYYTQARADARVAAGITALKAEADPFPAYSTAAEAQAVADAKVVDSITDGVTNIAPSQNAVFDALALKGSLAGANTWTGANTFAGSAGVGSEGGEFHITRPTSGTSMTGDVVVDAADDRVRVFAPNASGAGIGGVQFAIGGLNGLGTAWHSLNLDPATKGGLASGNTWTASNTFNAALTGMDQNTSDIANHGGIGAFEAKGAGGAAAMLFHRPSVFAAYFGIDTDNKWRVGGFSYGAASYEVWNASSTDISATTSYRIGAVQVVSARNTGWSAMTGAGSKATIAAAAAGTASAAYVQAELQAALNRIAALEARLRSLDAALFTHGLIGT